MPRLPKLDSHTLAVSSAVLQRGFVAASLLYPMAILSAFTTLILYFYLRYEYLFNSALVRSTPSGADDHLPSCSEWATTGGLKELPAAEPSGVAEEEYCSVCYHPQEDPVQIVRCDHIFCRSCLDAWLANGNRSCPQCTIKLWRLDAVEGSITERATKLLVAEGLISVPLTVYAVYASLVHYIFNSQGRITWAIAMLLVVFALSGILALLMAWEGLHFMLNSRRTHGAGWWGANLEADMKPGFKMAMMALSQWGAFCLAILSATIQTHVEWSWPLRYRIILGSIALPLVDRPWVWTETDSQNLRLSRVERPQAEPTDTEERQHRTSSSASIPDS